MAAHFCPKCNQEVSSAARFCPNCAAPLGASLPAAAPAMATMDAAAKTSRRLLVPALILALVVLTVAVAVLAAKSRKQPSVLVTSVPFPPAAPPVVTAPVAPASTAPPLTSAPTPPPTAAPAVTNAPVRPVPTLPPDVAAYLTFLQGIEQRRIAMSNDLSGAMAMMTMAQGLQGAQADPEGGEETTQQNTQKLSQGYNDYALKWQGLIRDFRATPAPPPCGLLANQYLKYLADNTTVITKLQVALLNHDPKGLPDMSGVSQVQAQINADGAQADGELGRLCGRYGVPKPFSIGADNAAPSLLGH